MAGADRLVAFADQALGLGGQRVVGEGRFPLAVEIGFAAVDLGDHRLVVAAGDGVAQRQELTVRLGEEAAFLLRRAAQLADALAQPSHHLLALLRAGAEDFGELPVGRLAGRMAIAVDAVDRGFDEAVVDGDVMVVEHGLLLVRGCGRSTPGKSPRVRGGTGLSGRTFTAGKEPRTWPTATPSGDGPRASIRGAGRCTAPDRAPAGAAIRTRITTRMRWPAPAPSRRTGRAAPTKWWSARSIPTRASD